MSFLRTSLIALLAIGLGLYIYAVEAPQMAMEAKGDHVIDIEPAEVEHMKLTYPDTGPLELARKDGSWRLTAPIDAAADNHIVDLFIGALRDAIVERRIPKAEAEALASYGLEGSTGTRARLELTMAGGKALPAIVVGNTTPVDFHAFVRVEGNDEVLVTPLIFHTSVKKTAFEFRNKTLLHVVPQTIARLTIEKPGARIELEKDGNRWKMLAPVSDRADAEAVRSLVSTMPDIEAIAYFEGAEIHRDKFGLDAPSLSVTAGLDDGGKVAFTLGVADQEAPAGSYFERIQDGPGAPQASPDVTTGRVAKVADWVASTFGVNANDVRDRQLLDCAADQVVKMAYTRDGDTFTLGREGAGKPWTIEPAGEGAVVQRITDNALQALIDLRGDSLIGDAADEASRATYGLDKPLARVELSDKNGPCGAITAGSTAPGAATPVFHLQSDDRTAVLTASASQMSRLSMRRAEFVEMKADAAAKESPGEAEPAAVKGEEPAAP